MARGLPERRIGNVAELETQRLVLSRLGEGDEQFVVRLLNDPAFLRYVGDKGVRDADTARHYIETGPVASYKRYGFGLYKVALRQSGEPVGMCGLLKREALDDVDVGFALLPEFRSMGYAMESASAVMQQGREQFGLTRIVAITAPDNASSSRLLRRLGMRYEGKIAFPGEQAELNLFGWNRSE
jgi:RimJ/RimL family protein N-acetyltransferase